MREILFCGKRIDNGEWVEGGYYLDPYPNKVYIVQWNSTGMGFADHIEVYPETVGQYTGLKDRNGQRIFEGDIVKRCFTLTRGEHKKTRETQVGIVRYKNSECGFWLENACNLRRPWPGDTLEVIGNTHDNPELVKEEPK